MGDTARTGDFKCREVKLDFAEVDQCKPVLLGLSLAGNLVKPLMSLYEAEWREHGYGLCRLVRHCVGHLLFAATAATTSRLLPAPPAAATLSAAAAVLPATGSWADCQRHTPIFPRPFILYIQLLATAL